MSCKKVGPELVAYHFGLVSEATRDAVEAHLLGCPECLADLLVLKRAIETGDTEERPSRAARAQLRRAVAQRLEPAPRPWIWWERPLAASVAAAAVAGAVLTVRVVADSEGSAPRTLTMQPEAASSPSIEAH